MDHLERSLRAETDTLTARNLKVLVLRKLGRDHDATTLLGETRALDPLDGFARWFDDAELPPRADGELPPDGQQRLDLAFDLRREGLLDEALRVLSPVIAQGKPDGAETLRLYLFASTLKHLGHAEQSASVYQQAAASDPACVFPAGWRSCCCSKRPCGRTLKTRARRTIWAICSTTAGATAKRSRPGSEPSRSTRSSPPPGAISDLATSTCSATPHGRAFLAGPSAGTTPLPRCCKPIERFAVKLLASPAAIDYSSTSLPTMLLFHDDLQQRQTITARFLQAQATLGLGHTAEGMQTQREILSLDPAHAPSSDLLLLGVE